MKSVPAGQAGVDRNFFSIPPGPRSKPKCYRPVCRAVSGRCTTFKATVRERLGRKGWRQLELLWEDRGIGTGRVFTSQLTLARHAGAVPLEGAPRVKHVSGHNKAAFKKLAAAGFLESPEETLGFGSVILPAVRGTRGDRFGQHGVDGLKGLGWQDVKGSRVFVRVVRGGHHPDDPFALLVPAATAAWLKEPSRRGGKRPGAGAPKGNRNNPLGVNQTRPRDGLAEVNQRGPCTLLSSPSSLGPGLLSPSFGGKKGCGAGAPAFASLRSAPEETETGLGASRLAGPHHPDYPEVPGLDYELPPEAPRFGGGTNPEKKLPAAGRDSRPQASDPIAGRQGGRPGLDAPRPGPSRARAKRSPPRGAWTPSPEQRRAATLEAVEAAELAELATIPRGDRARLDAFYAAKAHRQYAEKVAARAKAPTARDRLLAEQARLVAGLEEQADAARAAQAVRRVQRKAAPPRAPPVTEVEPPKPLGYDPEAPWLTEDHDAIETAARRAFMEEIR